MYIPTSGYLTFHCLENSNVQYTRYECFTSFQIELKQAIKVKPLSAYIVQAERGLYILIVGSKINRDLLFHGYRKSCKV